MTDGAAAQTREPLKNGGTRNLANPLWCFHGFRLCVIILTIFGVIMVFSSSSVNMIANGQSPWAQALKQGMYCVFGLVIAFITMMLPVMGVPMPFVSAGGSSLIMCLGAAGVAISLMKEQPQVKAENRIL